MLTTGKTAKFNFLGTGIISPMPVPHSHLCIRVNLENAINLEQF